MALIGFACCRRRSAWLHGRYLREICCPLSLTLLCIPWNTEYTCGSTKPSRLSTASFESMIHKRSTSKSSWVKAPNAAKNKCYRASSSVPRQGQPRSAFDGARSTEARTAHLRLSTTLDLGVRYESSQNSSTKLSLSAEYSKRDRWRASPSPPVLNCANHGEDKNIARVQANVD